MSTLPAERLDWSDALRVRPIGLASWDMVLRAGIAATVAYAFSLRFSASQLPIFAPVTTLLVVQASPFAALGQSVQRVGGTALGVALATAYVNVVGTGILAFGAAVIIALALAKLLPVSLAAQMQIPIAVVFVMAIGPDTLATDLWRVTDVLVGGAIGLAAVYAWPPRPAIEPARRAIADAREALAAQLRAVAAELGAVPRPLVAGERHQFMVGSRSLFGYVVTAREATDRLIESARFNPRALRAGARVDGLARAYRRLSGLSVQVRALSAAADRLYDRPGEEPVLPAREFGALAVALAETLEAVRLDGDDLTFAAEPADADALGRRIRADLARVSAQRDTVSDVLDSVSLLGRLDYLRVTLAGGPDYGEAEEEAAVGEDTAHGGPADSPV